MQKEPSEDGSFLTLSDRIKDKRKAGGLQGSNSGFVTVPTNNTVLSQPSIT